MAKITHLFDYESDLIKLNHCDFTEDFVAISSEIDENSVCKHSGLIICVEENIYYYHYTGKEVLLTNITKTVNEKESIFIKKLNIIVEEEVISFLGHCEKLKRKGVSPLYGFVFNSSYYNSESKESFLINAEHDITTCVGFCIKIIRGFLYNNDEYLKIEDWNINSLDNVEASLFDYINRYLLIYATTNNLTVAELFSQSELKRILPSELLCSAFFNELPISKSSVDSIRPNLENYILNYVA